MYKSREEVFHGLVSLEPKAKAIHQMIDAIDGNEEAHNQYFRVSMLRGIAQNPMQVGEGELNEWLGWVKTAVDTYKTLAEQYPTTREYIKEYLVELGEIKDKAVDYYQNRQEVEEDLFS
ncbi:hypothetical protein P9X10_02600 [Bacillus cereus]|nr:hypothetical protein [Bacillus cereus]